MSNKLCYNCFEPIVDGEMKCSSCGALNTREIRVASKLGGQITTVSGDSVDYQTEIDRLEELSATQVGDKTLLLKTRRKDLTRISILTSILGIMQIYTAAILDSLNEILVAFDEEQTVDGSFLIFSGFIYFILIPGFYYRFNITRKVILVGNFIHLALLFSIYESLAFLVFFARVVQEFNLINDLPLQLKLFINNLKQFQYLMFGFALFYVIQIVYMYRPELLNLRYR